MATSTLVRKIIAGATGASMLFNTAGLQGGELDVIIPGNDPTPAFTTGEEYKTTIRDETEFRAFQLQLRQNAPQNKLALLILNAVSHNELSVQQATIMAEDFANNQSALKTMQNNPVLYSVKVGQGFGFDLSKIIKNALPIKVDGDIHAGVDQQSEYRQTVIDDITRETGVIYMSRDANQLSGGFSLNAKLEIPGIEDVYISRRFSADAKENSDYLTLLETFAFARGLEMRAIDNGDFAAYERMERELFDYIKQCEHAPSVNAGNCDPTLAPLINAMRKINIGTNLFKAFDTPVAAEQYIRQEVTTFVRSRGEYIADNLTLPELASYMTPEKVEGYLSQDMNTLEQALRETQDETFLDRFFDTNNMVTEDDFKARHIAYQKRIANGRDNVKAAYQIVTLFAHITDNPKLAQDAAKAYQFLDAGLVVADSISKIASGTAQGGALGPYGAIAGAIMGLIGSFGSSGDDGTTAILKAINDMKLDIRLDLARMDNKLDYILKGQRMIIEAVLDNAYYLQLTREDMWRLEDSINRLFILSEKETQEIKDRIDELSRHMDERFDAQTRIQQEDAFSAIDTDFNIALLNRDGNVDTRELRDYQIAFQSFMAVRLRGETFVRPMTPLEAVGVPASERAGAIHDVLVQGKALVDERLRAVFLESSEYNGDRERLKNWLPIYENAIDPSVAENLPHPDFFSYFYQRYANLTAKYAGTASEQIFSLAALDADVENQRKTILELLDLIPPLTTILQDRLHNVSDSTKLYVHNAQEEFLNHFAPISNDMLLNIIDEIAKANPEDVGYDTYAPMKDIQLETFLLQASPDLWAKIVEKIPLDDLVRIAEYRGYVTHVQFDDKDVQTLAPIDSNIAREPAMEVYTGTVPLLINGVAIPDGYDPQAWYDFYHGPKTLMFPIQPPFKQPGRINSSHLIYVVPLGQRFDPGTCNITFAEGTEQWLQDQTRCIPVMPVENALGRMTEERIDQYLAMRKTVHERLKDSPYFADNVQEGWMLMEGDTPPDFTGIKYISGPMYTIGDKLGLVRHKQPYNLALNDDGIEYLKAINYEYLDAIEAERLLFTLKFEEWATMSNPAKVPASVAETPGQREDDIEVYRKQLELTPDEDAKRELGIEILRLVTTQAILDFRDDRVRAIQQTLQTSNREDLDRLKLIYPIIVTAAEWGMGECLYTNPGFDPYQKFVDGIHVENGPNQHFNDVIDKLLTSENAAEVATAYYDFQKFEAVIAEGTLPTYDVDTTYYKDGIPWSITSIKEIDREALYGSAQSCGLGHPSIRATVSTRDRIKPPTP